MANNDQIKTKLKVVNSKGFGWVLMDVLDIIAEDLGIEPGEDESIGTVVKKYMGMLRAMYKKQEKVEDIKSKQIDIESVIIELRLEKLAEISKPIKNDTDNNRIQQ